MTNEDLLLSHIDSLELRIQFLREKLDQKRQQLARMRDGEEPPRPATPKKRK